MIQEGWEGCPCLLAKPAQQCKRRANAVGLRVHLGRRTNTHNNEEPGQKPPKIYNSTSRAFHKVIWVRRATAYPVRQWCDHVGRDDEKREVVVEERGAQDHEEEADSKDLLLDC